MAKNTSLTPAAGLFSKPAHEVHKVQHVHEVQEVNAHNISGMPKTQGRKGQKLPRINMAFTPENYEFLRCYPRRNDLSMTEYVNQLIEKDRLRVTEIGNWN